MRSHSCVLGSCLVGLVGQLHAVPLLSLQFLAGLSYGSNSCGLTPVSWVLVWFVFRVNFMRSRFCVLGSCLVYLMNEIHAVQLLCPGFLSGLFSGSNSCGPTPVSWVLVCFVLGRRFKRSHSCVLVLSGLSSGSSSCGRTPVS